MNDLLVKNSCGVTAKIEPGLVAYIWASSGGLVRATRAASREIARTRFEALCFHAGTAEILDGLSDAWSVAKSITKKTASLWLGVGIDGTIRAWARGQITANQVVERHAKVALLANNLGVEVIVLNGESAWKLRDGDKRTSADVRALAHDLAMAYVSGSPGSVLALSSFGSLGQHADVRAMIEGITPHCSMFTGQSYAARGGVVMPGVLPAIAARDERSQEATERQQWLRPDLEGDGETDTDLDRLPTVQAHKTDSMDLCRFLCERHHVLIWSLPEIANNGRADIDGLDAIHSASIIRSIAGSGANAVRDFQAFANLKIDGIPGPLTRAAAVRLGYQR